MVFQIYNTLTGKKERFESLSKDKVKMFVCGPTVYDLMHLGHARTFIFYDILARFIVSKGYGLDFVINITDLDDKVFTRAKAEKVEYKVISEKYTEAFYNDLRALGVRDIITFAKASDFVKESIEQVVKLVEKGYAYPVAGMVFYDTSKHSDYGKLSHQSMVELKLRRLDIDPNKKMQSDFLLWRPSEKDEPVWSSPYGNGRPGWHIEDTAISIKILGQQYDIHGGAGDLVFPHHEAEIAQAEAITGRKPFVKYWVHMGILDISGNKMSKSLGNYITVKDALKEHGVDELRLYFCNQNYRNRIELNSSELRSASESALTIEQTIKKLKLLLHKSRSSSRQITEKQWKKFEVDFYNALDDDLNTPHAITALLSFVQWVKNDLKKNASRETIEDILQSLLSICWILGLSFANEYRINSKHGVIRN